MKKFILILTVLVLSLGFFGCNNGTNGNGNGGGNYEFPVEVRGSWKRESTPVDIVELVIDKTTIESFFNMLGKYGIVDYNGSNTYGVRRIDDGGSNTLRTFNLEIVSGKLILSNSSSTSHFEENTYVQVTSP